VIPPLSRVDGVGEITVFGAQYAMRIWLDPHKLNSYGLLLLLHLKPAHHAWVMRPILLL
jgi:Cu/Ag efflux pump CusA